jgi:hypothetical protein
MLSAEPEPKPGVDERLVGRGDDHVVPGPALFDPVLSCGGVEVPYVFRLLDGVGGGFDPDVRAPDVVGAPRAEQVTDDLAVPQRGRSRGAFARPQRSDLSAKVDRLQQ